MPQPDGDNLRIWNALAKTDPKHTKPFNRSGGFKGTAVKPIYQTRKMTELFGPCGVGWGMTKPDFTTCPGADNETLVYCTVGLWHGEPGNLVYGVGGDKVVGKNKHGLFSDDEAFKKSYTDALSNAMKQIGAAADIHMGQHDDDKYVTAMRQEFAGETPQSGVVTDGNGNPPDRNRKTSRDPDWKGPLTKTELSDEMKAFFSKVGECGHIETLEQVVDEYAAVIAQCKVDMRGWWDGNGTPRMPKEFVPGEQRLTAKRNFLNNQPQGAAA